MSQGSDGEGHSQSGAPHPLTHPHLENSTALHYPHPVSAWPMPRTYRVSPPHGRYSPTIYRSDL